MATRQYELSGIVKPEIDDRALEQSKSRMRKAFDRAAAIKPSLDLSGIKRKLKRGLTGGLLGGRSSSAGGGGAGGEGVATLLSRQNEMIDDIRDAIERGGLGGDGGGGGGGVVTTAATTAVALSKRVRSAAGRLFSRLTDAGKRLWGRLKQAGSSFKSLTDRAGSGLRTAGDKVGEALRSGGDRVQSALGRGKKTLDDVFKNLPSPRSAVDDALSGVKGVLASTPGSAAVKQGAGAAGSASKGLLGRLSKGASKLPGLSKLGKSAPLLGLGFDAVDIASGTASRGSKGLISEVGGFIGSVGGAAKGASAGGVVGGPIGALIGGVGGAVGGEMFTEAAIGGATDLFRSFSPREVDIPGRETAAPNMRIAPGQTVDGQPLSKRGSAGASRIDLSNAPEPGDDSLPFGFTRGPGGQILNENGNPVDQPSSEKKAGRDRTEVRIEKIETSLGQGGSNLERVIERAIDRGVRNATSEIEDAVRRDIEDSTSGASLRR